MREQKTLHERWRENSKEEGAGIRFHEAPEGAEKVELEGFTEEELKQIRGDVDEIEEI